MIDLTAIVITLFIVFVIFIICREVTCWYWKINMHIGLIEKQNKLLEDIKYFMINKKEKPTYDDQFKKEVVVDNETGISDEDHEDTLNKLRGL